MYARTNEEQYIAGIVSKTYVLTFEPTPTNPRSAFSYSIPFPFQAVYVRTVPTAKHTNAALAKYSIPQLQKHNSYSKQQHFTNTHLNQKHHPQPLYPPNHPFLQSSGYALCSLLAM